MRKTLIAAAICAMAASAAPAQICGQTALAASAPGQTGAAAPAPADPGAVGATAATSAESAWPEALRFADELAARSELGRDWLRCVLGQVRAQPQLRALMLPPPAGVAKNWQRYRSRFVEPQRIRAGLRFWQANRGALERAEREFGVAAQIIVGIIGVETLYGEHMGNWRVLDALTTLALAFPAQHPRAAERSAFFRDELEQFLRLMQRSGADPLGALGSYAGAMGLAQFMPSSWLRYAIDFDGDGRIDLYHSSADAIGSIANFLRQHGWTRAMPTHFAVQLAAPNSAQQQQDLATLLAPDIVPSFSAARMQALGATPEPAAAAHGAALALVELENGDAAPSHVAGTDNFYALTRYNRSSYYAMAVLELGQAVAAAEAAARGAPAAPDPARAQSMDRQNRSAP